MRRAIESRRPASVREAVSPLGTKLMTRAYFAAAELGLGHAPTRLLVYMALRALDDDTPPVSFIGRDTAAEVLGNRGTDAQRHDAVKKVIGSLKRAGVIALRNKPHEGRRAEYVLHLPARVDASSPLYRSEGGTQIPSGGKPDPQEGGTGVPPNEYLKREIEEEAPSPYCRFHPTGTDKPCFACKTAREAFEQRPRKVKQFVVHPEDLCADGSHKWMPDGTCNFCTERKIAKNDEWMYR